jgi:hypothetical protein
MPAFDIDTYVGRSRAVDLAAIDWAAWPDFCAVHMTRGAINELTTLAGYRRLAAVTDHPVLADLLERIVLDESRHFFFYYRQAELRFLATYLFGGPEGRAAARKVDETIRRLPGFETVQLLESWMDRHNRHAMPPR